MKQPRNTIPARMRMQLINQKNRVKERLTSAPSMSELGLDPQLTSHSRIMTQLDQYFFDPIETPRDSDLIFTLVGDELPTLDDHEDQ